MVWNLDWICILCVYMNHTQPNIKLIDTNEIQYIDIIDEIIMWDITGNNDWI